MYNRILSILEDLKNSDILMDKDFDERNICLNERKNRLHRTGSKKTVRSTTCTYGI